MQIHQISHYTKEHYIDIQSIKFLSLPNSTIHILYTIDIQQIKYLNILKNTVQVDIQNIKYLSIPKSSHSQGFKNEIQTLRGQGMQELRVIF